VSASEYDYPDRQILPAGEMPFSGYECNLDAFWSPTDTEELFRHHGGHPLYGEEDILYRTNSYGYRAPEFGPADDIAMLATGCSCTFGVGVRAAETYHEIFANRLRYEIGRSVTSWNLGVSGASLDFVSRSTLLAVRALRPHIVLLLIPPLSRREHHTPEGCKYMYVPCWRNGPSHDEVLGPAFDNLASEGNNSLTLFRDVVAIQNMLRTGVFLFSFAYQTDPGPVSRHFDRKCWVDKWDGRFLDQARDYDHPGPRTHRRIADLFWEKLVETGGLDHIRAQRAWPRNTPAHDEAGVPAMAGDRS
jgi:hypothetical protein